MTVLKWAKNSRSASESPRLSRWTKCSSNLFGSRLVQYIVFGLLFAQCHPLAGAVPRFTFSSTWVNLEQRKVALWPPPAIRTQTGDFF
jgi:hypothetical protein